MVVAGYLAKLDDETARDLTARIDEAFVAMEVENIATVFGLPDETRRTPDRPDLEVIRQLGRSRSCAEIE